MIKGIAIANKLTSAVAIVLPTTKDIPANMNKGHECDKISNDKFVKDAV